MEGGDLCLRKTTAGVDLNRNWEYAWNKVHTSIFLQRDLQWGHVVKPVGHKEQELSVQP